MIGNLGREDLADLTKQLALMGDQQLGMLTDKEFKLGYEIYLNLNNSYELDNTNVLRAIIAAYASYMQDEQFESMKSDDDPENSKNTQLPF